jgi:hypothetical protein
VNPERAEDRRQERHRDDQAAAKSPLFRHHPEQRFIRDDVGAADLEGPAGRFRDAEALHEVIEGVVDGNRLAGGADPARRDEDRQAFREVAQDLERRRAGADDHGGTECRQRHRPGAEDRLHLTA